MEIVPTDIRRLVARGPGLPAGVSPPGTRGLILGAALRLFAERGFGRTSIRAIAKEAGIQSATLYAHYPSKEHVLAELVRIGHEEHYRRIRSALLKSQPDPRRQLTAVVRAHVGMHAELPMLAMVTNAEMYELSEELAAPSLTLRQQAAHILIDIILRGTESGVFDSPHPWVAAAAIGGMGMRVANWYDPEFELSAAQISDVYAVFALRIVNAVKETNG
jgi:AcrR family transcriptional regulator